MSDTIMTIIETRWERISVNGRASKRLFGKIIETEIFDLQSKITELEAKLKVCEDALRYFSCYIDDGIIAREALNKLNEMRVK
jgi:hypothetical protein